MVCVRSCHFSLCLWSRHANFRVFWLTCIEFVWKIEEGKMNQCQNAHKASVSLADWLRDKAEQIFIQNLYEHINRIANNTHFVNGKRHLCSELRLIIDIRRKLSRSNEILFFCFLCFISFFDLYDADWDTIAFVRKSQCNMSRQWNV